MTTQQNLLIVVLAVTALLLSAAVVGVLTTDDASAQVSVKSGRYVVCTASYSSATELVYILDMQSKKLNVYVADEHARTLERVGRTLGL